MSGVEFPFIFNFHNGRLEVKKVTRQRFWKTFVIRYDPLCGQNKSRIYEAPEFIAVLKKDNLATGSFTG